MARFCDSRRLVSSPSFGDSEIFSSGRAGALCGTRGQKQAFQPTPSAFATEIDKSRPFFNPGRSRPNTLKLPVAQVARNQDGRETKAWTNYFDRRPGIQKQKGFMAGSGPQKGAAECSRNSQFQIDQAAIFR